MSLPHRFITFDLLSNFLTHAYLDLLESLYNKEEPLTSSSQVSPDFIKSLKSFHFIFQNNTRHLIILQQQVFDYFQPYRYLSKDQIINHQRLNRPESYKPFAITNYSLNFTNLRKQYSKQITPLRKSLNYPLWKQYNIDFLHMHRNLIYHSFKNEASLPDLLKASTAEEFVAAVTLLLSELT